MESVFYTKCNNGTLDIGDFSTMIERAKALISNYETQKYTQAIVMLTSSNTLCDTLIENVLDEDCSNLALFNSLKDNHDTKILQIVCMWSDGCLDMPSYDFRKTLYDIHENNKDAILLLPSANGRYIKMMLKQTLNMNNK